MSSTQVMGSNSSSKLFDNLIEVSNKFVTDFVVAETLGLSVWTIRKWHKQNQIPSHKFGRSVRYVVNEVLTALNQKGSKHEK